MNVVMFEISKLTAQKNVTIIKRKDELLLIVLDDYRLLETYHTARKMEILFTFFSSNRHTNAVVHSTTALVHSYHSIVPQLLCS